MNFIIVYALAPDKTKAKKIARRLLAQKLIVCANIFPVESLFLWEGKIAKNKETAMVLKTMEEKFEALKIEIKAMHPYEVPCIIKIKGEPNSKYLTWASRELFSG